MRIHKTKTGTVEIVGQPWRDGEMPQAVADADCLTVCDDITNAVWRFTGELRDAAEVVGKLYVNGGAMRRERVARLTGRHIEIEPPPANLFRGKGEPHDDGEFDDFEFDALAHPDIVAY